jgi:hypothetical protein
MTPERLKQIQTFVDQQIDCTFESWLRIRHQFYTNSSRLSPLGELNNHWGVGGWIDSFNDKELTKYRTEKDIEKLLNRLRDNYSNETRNSDFYRTLENYYADFIQFKNNQNTDYIIRPEELMRLIKEFDQTLACESKKIVAKTTFIIIFISAQWQIIESVHENYIANIGLITKFINLISILGIEILMSNFAYKTIGKIYLNLDTTTEIIKLRKQIKLYIKNRTLGN